MATRRAYGNALKRLFPAFPDLVVLDGEVGNSTYAEIFAQAYPERFFEMYVAEQNMVGVALGLARRGQIPFVSTFAAFFTRAFDQIRMSRYSGANIKFCGSHAGVAIGEDGASQMWLEDIALFRTLLDGVVLYPADAVSTERLVEQAARHEGIVYLRTTRQETPILYDTAEAFPIGAALLSGCRPSAGPAGGSAGSSALTAGALAGLIGGAFNANGPVIALYAAGRGWAKRETHAALQLYFFVSGLAIVALHGAGGITSRQVLLAALFCLPFLGVGSLAGWAVHRRVDEERYRLLLRLSLLAAGAALLVSAARA